MPSCDAIYKRKIEKYSRTHTHIHKYTRVCTHTRKSTHSNTNTLTPAMVSPPTTSNVSTTTFIHTHINTHQKQYFTPTSHYSPAHPNAPNHPITLTKPSPQPQPITCDLRALMANARSSGRRLLRLLRSRGLRVWGVGLTLWYDPQSGCIGTCLVLLLITTNNSTN